MSLLKHTETNMQPAGLVDIWNHKPITMREASETEFSAKDMRDMPRSRLQNNRDYYARKKRARARQQEG